MRQSYLSPAVEVRDAGAKGLGLHATAPIPAGTTVAGFGGTVVHRDEFDGLSEHRRTHSLQIDDELFLVGPDEMEPADYVNHSCDPNVGIVGNVLLVAMRDIAPGEEICFDYAMCDADDYDEFACACGAERCRHVVTSHDWQRPDLQARYRGFMSSYLQRRIDSGVAR